jgi:hypothetical protein
MLRLVWQIPFLFFGVWFAWWAGHVTVSNNAIRLRSTVGEVSCACMRSWAAGGRVTLLFHLLTCMHRYSAVFMDLLRP